MIDGLPFSERNVAILGLGASGLAAARALRQSGANLIAWDDDAARRRDAADAGIALGNLDRRDRRDWSATAALVLSPGIPYRCPNPHPVAAAADAAGCEVIGDIELLLRARPQARYVGITGTNGKSTTTALIAHLLEAAGMRVEVGGNLGPPALSLAALDANGTYVLELSSFQLDLTPSARFDIAVLINIDADHLDRHGGMAGYVAAKKRIFAAPAAAPPLVAVIGADDEHCRAIHDEIAARGTHRIIPISASAPASGGVHVRDGILHDDLDGEDSAIIDLAPIATLPGRHNWQNAAAAYAVARTRGIAAADIARAMPGFPGLAHRQEQIAEIDGIRFVNDSKATNSAAAAAALASYDSIYWIAGGRPKPEDGGIAETAGYLDHVAHAFLIGEAMVDFATGLDGKVAVTRSGDLATAVADAYQLARAEARPGAVVLLAPACASFDQFRDFEERGDTFRALVAELAGHREAAS